MIGIHHHLPQVVTKRSLSFLTIGSISRPSTFHNTINKVSYSACILSSPLRSSTTTTVICTTVRNSWKRTYHPTTATRQHPKEAASAETKQSFAKENPFLFQLIVATVKTVAADLTTQVVAEHKSWHEIDWKRNGIFVIFGFAYLGGFQYYLMVHKYRQWFPTMDVFASLSLSQKLQHTAGLLDAGKMVLFDICIHLPILYFPTYYTVKEFVAGTTWNPIDWVHDGVTKYRKNMHDDLTAMVQVWGPSDCIQFVLPVYMRLPFRHFVSFFWTAYVSFTRGAIIKEEVTLPTPAE